MMIGNGACESNRFFCIFVGRRRSVIYHVPSVALGLFCERLSDYLFLGDYGT